MVITIGASTLCDGADRSVDKSSGPNNFQLAGNVSPQVSEAIRADDVTVYNRKNRRSDVSFGVKRQCASVSAAASWALLHPVTVVRNGTLTMTEAGSSVQMLNAVVQQVRCSLVGLSVLVDYAIVGGKLQGGT